jgi:hypothetical protein
MVRRRFVRTLPWVAVAAVAATVAATISVTPAYATAVDSIGVDMSGSHGAPNTNETGFLYGLTVNGSETSTSPAVSTTRGCTRPRSQQARSGR